MMFFLFLHGFLRGVSIWERWTTLLCNY